MKKVLLLMAAVMLIVGLMAVPALADAPDDPNALGEFRSVQVQENVPFGSSLQAPYVHGNEGPYGYALLTWMENNGGF